MMWEYQVTAEMYEQMKAIDIRSVDPDTVTDIRDIHVDPELPPAERLQDVARQMNGNPFLYRCGKLLVKTSFAGTLPLQTVLEDCLEHSK